MCGRYAFLLPHESWRGLYKVLNDFAYIPRYNITPTQPVVTIMEREGRRTPSKRLPEPELSRQTRTLSRLE